MLQARLKPYDPRKGHVLQRISYGRLNGKRFEQGFWYAVSETEAAFLREQHQKPNDPNSPFAFDVCTAEEAEQLTTDETRSVLLGTPNARKLVIPAGRTGPELPRPLSPGEKVEDAPPAPPAPGEGSDEQAESDADEPKGERAEGKPETSEASEKADQKPADEKRGPNKRKA